MVSLEGDSEGEDVMDTGPGWLPDPEHEGQERYWDGSGWTDQVRPVGSLRSLHLSDHVPELQRALAGSTADIDEVEDRLATLFARPGKPGGSRAQGGAVADGGAGAGAGVGVVQRRPPAPAPSAVEPENGPDEEFDLTLTAIDEVDEAMDKIVLELDDADEEPDDVDDEEDALDLDDDYDDDDLDDNDEDEDEDMDEIVLDLDDADDDVADDDEDMDAIVLDLDDADDDVADEIGDSDDDVDVSGDDVDDDNDDAFAELDAALAAETPDEPDRRLLGRKI
jgi:hypothetical protein